MRALIFLKKLDLYSGTGQLLRTQVHALRAAGMDAMLACERGGLRYFLRTGIRTKRVSASVLRARAGDPDGLIVDHNLAIPEADVVFVHNLATDANRYLPVADPRAAAAEREFFAALPATTPVVANSALVQGALVEHFDLSPERIVVHHPGHEAARFAPGTRQELRARARRQLGWSDSTPVIGLVTSGNFRKRGLDLLLASAEHVVAAEPDARLLVVGARELPKEVVRHPLFASGNAVYRPKNHWPELWMAALDVFVYPARYEEFGMVVLEALALGVPVVTSRRVGAAECLPPEYSPWLGAVPDEREFATRTLDLLRDAHAREALAAAGSRAALERDAGRYGAETAATILAQKRRLR
ncbi:MAG TPA: glycosyltransferase family 4 protein [Gammaproteobacteria bacterium]|jgi:glycosyltransferase involved in cell wall biosynthesis|nr:glycosyltransferase family 4 protein [Gammaproteobacteria bacterium]